MLSPTDWELAERARDGDRDAFHQLVDRHAPRLYPLAAVMTGNHTDAQDLVQETLLAAYEALPGFEARSTVKTWLTGIMIRQASLMRRKESRNRRMESLDAPGRAEPANIREGNSGETSGGVEARMDLMALMAKLSEEHRQVLALRELEGLSYEEIARMTGQPRGTVESRLFRARQALRELARKSEAGPSPRAGGVP